MTKQDLLEAMHELASACRSFQSAYALYEGETPSQLDEIWDYTENLVEYADGKWQEKWMRKD